MFAIAAALVLVLPVAAKTIEVGSDAQYTDIQAAADAASDGDTVSVAAGYYEVPAGIEVSTDDVTLQGAGADQTILDGDDSAYAVVSIKAGNVTVTGFTLKGGSSHGVYVNEQNYGNIHHNVITGNSDRGILLGSGEPYAVIDHNTFANNKVSAIYSYRDEPRTRFTNNIVYENGRSIVTDYDSSNMTIKWNCFYGQSNDSVAAASSKTNILKDPVFVDGVLGDFHLKDGSPCLGAGQNGTDIGALGTGKNPVISQTKTETASSETRTTPAGADTARLRLWTMMDKLSAEAFCLALDSADPGTKGAMITEFLKGYGGPFSFKVTTEPVGFNMASPRVSGTQTHDWSDSHTLWGLNTKGTADDVTLYVNLHFLYAVYYSSSSGAFAQYTLEASVNDVLLDDDAMKKEGFWVPFSLDWSCSSTGGSLSEMRGACSGQVLLRFVLDYTSSEQEGLGDLSYKPEVEKLAIGQGSQPPGGGQNGTNIGALGTGKNPVVSQTKTSTDSGGKYRVVVFTNNKDLGNQILGVIRAAGFANSDSYVTDEPNDDANIKYGAADPADVAKMRKLATALYGSSIKESNEFGETDKDVFINLP
jgi:hypothetical protein